MGTACLVGVLCKQHCIPCSLCCVVLVVQQVVGSSGTTAALGAVPATAGPAGQRLRASSLLARQLRLRGGGLAGDDGTEQSESALESLFVSVPSADDITQKEDKGSTRWFGSCQGRGHPEQHCDDARDRFQGPHEQALVADGPSKRDATDFGPTRHDADECHRFSSPASAASSSSPSSSSFPTVRSIMARAEKRELEEQGRERERALVLGIHPFFPVREKGNEVESERAFRERVLPLRLASDGSGLKPWQRTSRVNESCLDVLHMRLLASARLGDAHSLQGLVDAGASLTAVDTGNLSLTPAGGTMQRGWTSLHYAAAYGRTATCSALCKLDFEQRCPGAARPGCHPDLLHMVDAWNATALHYAALHGRTGTVHGLIEIGAIVNARTCPGGFTPLHYAAMNGHRDTCIRLIHLGAQVGAQSKWGQTAQELAAECGQDDMAGFLRFALTKTSSGGWKYGNFRNNSHQPLVQKAQSDAASSSVDGHGEMMNLDRAMTNPSPHEQNTGTSSRPGEQLAAVRCHFCHGLGHLSRECRSAIQVGEGSQEDSRRSKLRSVPENRKVVLRGLPAGAQEGDVREEFYQRGLMEPRGIKCLYKPGQASSMAFAECQSHTEALKAVSAFRFGSSQSLDSGSGEAGKIRGKRVTASMFVDPDVLGVTRDLRGGTTLGIWGRAGVRKGTRRDGMGGREPSDEDGPLRAERKRVFPVFVGQVPREATDHDLRTFFSKFGLVAGVYLMRDRVTQESKGSAFVRFTHKDHAWNAIEAGNSRALQLSGDGPPLIVKWAVENERYRQSRLERRDSSKMGF